MLTTTMSAAAAAQAATTTIMEIFCPSLLSPSPAAATRRKTGRRRRSRLPSASSTSTTTLLLVATLCLLLHTAWGLDCYTSVDQTVEEDCQMHTGCAKKFDPKTKRTLWRGCYLSSGVNDSCGLDPDGVGICYCHSKLCNGADSAVAASSAWICGLVAAAAARTMNLWAT